jgi:hypothetical protein
MEPNFFALKHVLLQVVIFSDLCFHCNWICICHIDIANGNGSQSASSSSSSSQRAVEIEKPIELEPAASDEKCVSGDQCGNFPFQSFSFVNFLEGISTYSIDVNAERTVEKSVLLTSMLACVDPPRNHSILIILVIV